VRLESLIHGAAHESGRRAGTESALLAAGLGAASTLAQDLAWTKHVRELRDRFCALLQERFGDRVRINGHLEHRLPNTLNVSFVGRNGTDLLAALDGVAASTGSACHSGRVDPSPVLRAMGIPAHIGAGAVRFSLGRGTTLEEIDEVTARISTVLNRA
jgi:cysteine desulfurase